MKAWAMVAALCVLTSSTAIANEAPLTPVTEVSMAKALISSHRDVFKKKANGHRIAVAWTQVALESGRGAKTRAYNIGQIDNGRARYKSLREGAKAYWNAVSRCKKTLAYFDVGDAYGAGVSLGKCGYHKTDPATYGEAMRLLKSSFDKDVWPKIKGQWGH